MDRRVFIQKAGMAGMVLLAPPGLLAQASSSPVDTLEEGFRHPALTDRAQALWFWMNGHISASGITADLEAMKAAGLGGVLQFDAGISIPPGPVQWGSAEWLQMKLHAISEAQRLELQFAMHNCPGWSASGGPWITPEMAMKGLTWSELQVSGGRGINTTLPLPYHHLQYYRDVAVLAYPSLEGETGLQAYSVSASSGAVVREAVTGEQRPGAAIYPDGKTGYAWLLFRFEVPVAVRSVTFLISTVAEEGAPPPEGRGAVWLEASGNGEEFNPVATISTGLEAELRAGDKFITYDITPTTARYFRLRSQQARRYTQVRFSGITRLEQFLEKTGNRFQFDGTQTSPIYNENRQHAARGSVIDPLQILDITNHLGPDGRLQWQAPPGHWTLLRFGYTALPSYNKAAPAGGTGLECDKFSREAIEFHFSQMMDRLLPSMKALAQQGLAGLEIDSYEAGQQTWTTAFPAAFQQRRGYSILPYLPALTGRIVGSVDVTERFLWDYRRTGADLIADNYYGRFSELCREHSLTAYIEPYDKGPFEEMQAGARAHVAMGEYWWGLHSVLQGNRAVRRTPKLAASATNTNGRQLTGVEAFTAEPESSRWQEYPFSLKATGDKLFCMGVNRLFIHRFVHQPNSFARPGMTMGPWGIHFDRTNTWFQQSGGWLQYTARCQYLLQQGLPVRDLLYFGGEEANIYTRVERSDLHPTPPEGWDYDIANAETILQRVSITANEISLPHGMRYRVLVLQDYKGISLSLLQKLRDLVLQGMIVVGKKPAYSLGLSHLPEEARFRAIADELWGPEPVTNNLQRKVGKGTVAWNDSLPDLLTRFGIEPAFTASVPSGVAPVLFIQRRLPQGDLFFIANQRRTTEQLVCSFRVKKEQPEIWDPATSEMAPTTFYQINGGRTEMPLHLPPYGSLFVFFRRQANGVRLTGVKKDNVVLLQAKPFKVQMNAPQPAISNNFTISFWAKPEMNIMVRPSVHMGNVPYPYTDFYAVFPAPGRTIYGAGHATCGLAVGRNGVAVWEAETHPVMVLVAETPLAGWSHIALVYEAGRPTVYVNGKAVRSGEKSGAIVSPGYGHPFSPASGSYFNGDMTEPQIHAGLLSTEAISRLAAAGPPDPPAPIPVESALHNGTFAMRIWQNGHYRLQYHGRKEKPLQVRQLARPVPLQGDWQVRFPAGAGAPRSVKLDRLVSLHRHPQDGVRYFSGTANYINQFELSGKRLPGLRLFLDLGRVEVLASVRLNGKDLGTLWKPPFLVDITDAIKAGINELEVAVTNLWPNRLIGDEHLPDPDQFSVAGASGFEHLVGAGFEHLIGRPIAALPEWYLKGEPPPPNGRTTFTTWKHYRKDDPLLESGLIGPVMLREAMIVRT